MKATNVSQFSVDCQDFSVATSAVPSVVPTGAPNPESGSTSSASADASTDSGLSGGAKAGIAVAAVVGGLAFVGLLVFFVLRNNRKKRADMEARRIQEADSNPGMPSQMEMPPNEKKAAMEMPSAVPAYEMHSSMVPVEAPGNDKWGPPQELPGDYAPTEKEGSYVPPAPQRTDTQTVLSEGTTVVESEGKRNP
jgi:hypothetical protein